MPAAIYRFTRDLRLDDHAGLSAAAAFGEVLPVLIVDADLAFQLRDPVDHFFETVLAEFGLDAAAYLALRASGAI